MPSDEYASIGGGGALKIKGAKVGKKKKRKNKDKADLEKNLEAGGDSAVATTKRKGEDADEDRSDKGDVEGEDPDEAPAQYKTEAERRHDELKRKRLLQTAETTGARPELLKTHKERVEQLNTYLSKLSEHHDMPKIGPG